MEKLSTRLFLQHAWYRSKIDLTKHICCDTFDTKHIHSLCLIVGVCYIQFWIHFTIYFTLLGSLLIGVWPENDPALLRIKDKFHQPTPGIRPVQLGTRQHTEIIWRSFFLFCCFFFFFFKEKTWIEIICFVFFPDTLKLV